MQQKLGIGQPSTNSRTKDKKYRLSLSEHDTDSDPLSLTLAEKEQNTVLYTTSRSAKDSIYRIAFVFFFLLLFCSVLFFTFVKIHQKVQSHCHLSKNICISVNGYHIVDTTVLHILFFESHNIK